MPGLFYAGAPLETGGTAIVGGTAPYVRRIVPPLRKGRRVLDYGAGRSARNADYLREHGFACYAYDPFHSTGDDGWSTGCVSSVLPAETFDLVLTCYVLNVVPKHVEEEILRRCVEYAPRQVHITRNNDLVGMVTGAIAREDPTMTDFLMAEYFPHRCPEGIDRPWADIAGDPRLIRDICRHGVATRRGFQRIPYLEYDGYRPVAETAGWKAYHGGLPLFG